MPATPGPHPLAGVGMPTWLARFDRHGSLYGRMDAWSLILFPLAYGVATLWIIRRAFM